MNDQELVELLLDNYTKQYRIYKTLMDSINAGLPVLGAAPDMGRILPILTERSKAFDEIKALDDRIKSNKIGWDRRKKEMRSVQAETLRTLLKNIKDILGQVLDANRRLEETVSHFTKKASA